jgi:hypothetical protein
MRYDIVTMPVLLLMFAVGAAWLWPRLRRLARVQWLEVVLGTLAVVALLVFGIGDRRHPSGGPIHSFQAEHLFLQKNLALVPRGATVLTVWQKRLGEARDLDAQLGVPHALVVHERPDIRWRILFPEEVEESRLDGGSTSPGIRVIPIDEILAMAEEPRPSFFANPRRERRSSRDRLVGPIFFYAGSSCSLDPTGGARGTPDTGLGRAQVVVAARLCSSLAQAVGAWVARESREVLPGTWTYQQGVVHLAIGRLDWPVTGGARGPIDPMAAGVEITE